MTEIGSGAFIKCEQLEEAIIPDSVKIIGSQAFASCKKLSKLTLGSGLETIGNSAFSLCTSLEEIDLGSIQRIGSSAFMGCTKLVSVTIPKATNSIQKDAFVGCGNLTIYGYVNTTAQKYADNNDDLAFVPLNAKGAPVEINDVNADGDVNISDATELQRHIAEISAVDPAILSRAIKEYSGTATIDDVTNIQKKLAE